MKMQTGGRQCFAAIGSITQAQKAQRVLAALAIPSGVTKTEGSSSTRGCIYGIRFDRSQESNVRSALFAAHITVREWRTEE